MGRARFGRGGGLMMMTFFGKERRGRKAGEKRIKRTNTWGDDSCEEESGHPRDLGNALESVLSTVLKRGFGAGDSFLEPSMGWREVRGKKGEGFSLRKNQGAIISKQTNLQKGGGE